MNNNNRDPSGQQPERDSQTKPYGFRYDRSGNTGQNENDIGRGENSGEAQNENEVGFGENSGAGYVKTDGEFSDGKRQNEVSGDPVNENPGAMGSVQAGSDVRYNAAGNDGGSRNSDREKFRALDDYLINEEQKRNSGKEKKLNGLLLKICAVFLVVAAAFTGAFWGMYYVCDTALFKDSEFFQAFVAKYAGIKENKVEVDYITGEYTGDNIELAENILSKTAVIRVLSGSEGNQTVVSSGSGVVLSYSEDTGKAMIVTNHHVVSTASDFYVELYGDSAKYKGKVLHLDEVTDLGIVEVYVGKDLPVAQTADSDNLKAGQTVIVGGNPLGLGFAVSMGYVGSPSVNAGDMGGALIQLDVSVNPGNSGGGVFDTQGNLIGVVVSKAAGESIDGIGYAIPVNRMLSVIDDLLKYGYVKNRPALGVTVLNVTSTNWTSAMLGELNGYLFESDENKYGVYVIESTNSTELKKGDRIVSVDGIKITSSETLLKAISSKTPNTSVKIVVERAEVSGDQVTYKTVTVTVMLRERDWADELPG